MRSAIAALSPIALLLSGTSAFAQSGPWTISEANGPVTISDPSGDRRAREGVVVRPGAQIHTGNGGNAVLVRGREFVTVRPNSRIRIPAEQRERSVIQVIQDWGSAVFRIGKQKDPHFGVETPHLAAVVKGTVFTITVGEQGASMQVTEGAVEVETIDGGARDLVRPGAVALVTADDQLRLVIQGERTKVLDSPARIAPAAGVSGPLAEGGTTLSQTSTPVRVQRISAVIASEPADLEDLSGGFLEGEADVVLAMVADNAASSGRGSDASRGDAEARRDRDETNSSTSESDDDEASADESADDTYGSDGDSSGEGSGDEDDANGEDDDDRDNDDDRDDDKDKDKDKDEDKDKDKNDREDDDDDRGKDKDKDDRGDDRDDDDDDRGKDKDKGKDDRGDDDDDRDDEEDRDDDDDREDDNDDDRDDDDDDDRGKDKGKGKDGRGDGGDDRDDDDD